MTLAKLLPFFEEAPPTPAGPTHTFTMNVGNGGYNGPLGRGGIVSGSSFSYDTPGGLSVTIIHCRNVRGELNFALSGATSGAGRSAAEFPTRIVGTRGIATVSLVPQVNSLRDISGGVRQDYDPASGESGTVAGVWANGQDIVVQLYYD